MFIPFGTITTNRLVSRLATSTASVNTITKQRIRHIANKVQTKKCPKSIVAYINNLGTKSELPRRNTNITTMLYITTETYSVPQRYRPIFTILANLKQGRNTLILSLTNVNAYVVPISHNTLFRIKMTQKNWEHNPPKDKRHTEAHNRMCFPIILIKSTTYEQRRK